MEGDRLLISAHHTARARDLVPAVRERLKERLVVTVAGESGAGKSELGHELGRLLNEDGISATVLQQDDYFVFPPKTNHEMRRRNLEQVGLYEVKLDFLDSNCRSFLSGDDVLFKPVVHYDEDSIDTEEHGVRGCRVLVVEGTYTTSLRYAQFRVFIDRTYLHTHEHRKSRGRDALEPFVEDVLRREHTIISGHKALADAVVTTDFSSVALR